MAGTNVRDVSAVQQGEGIQRRTIDKNEPADARLLFRTCQAVASPHLLPPRAASTLEDTGISLLPLVLFALAPPHLPGVSCPLLGRAEVLGPRLSCLPEESPACAFAPPSCLSPAVSVPALDGEYHQP